jgi:adenylate cyclase
MSHRYPHRSGAVYNASADMFLRAIDERPSAYWVHRNLAPALWGAGRKNEAKDSLKILIDAYPKLTVKQYKNAMVLPTRVLERIGGQLIELGFSES